MTHTNYSAIKEMIRSSEYGMNTVERLCRTHFTTCVHENVTEVFKRQFDQRLQKRDDISGDMRSAQNPLVRRKPIFHDLND